MAEKAKAEGNNFVKKLLSSNLTWSIVAFILLVIICTIFQHDFLALSWNSNTGGLAGPLITMLQDLPIPDDCNRYDLGYLHRRYRPFGRFRYGSGRCRRHADPVQWHERVLSILIALAVGLAIGCVNGALVSFLGLQRSSPP